MQRNRTKPGLPVSFLRTKNAKNNLAYFAVAGILLLVAVALDLLVVPSGSIAILYAIPVLIAARRISPRGTVLFAVAAVAAQIASSFAHGSPFSVTSWYAAFMVLASIMMVYFAVELPHHRQEAAQQAERLQTYAAEADRERNRLQALVGSISDEVWYCDADGQVRLMNGAAANWMGLADAEGGDHSLTTLISPSEIWNADGTPRPVEDAPLLRSLRGETIRQGEETARHHESGEVRYREFSSTPVTGEEGMITGAVAVVRDVTERKRAEEALRESE